MVMDTTNGGRGGNGRLGAIVFDFDGVLVNSEPAHGAALEAAGALLGLRSPEGGPGWYIGLGDVECFLRMGAASGQRLAAEDVAQLIAAKSEAFAEACRKGLVETYPGSVELLRAAAEVAPVAVCSGSHRRDIEPILARLGVLGMLREVVAADDVRRTKPDPEPYLLTAARLGVEPRRCVAIEDSPAGIASAVAAGYGQVHGVCHTFGAEWLGSAHQVHPSTAAMRAEILYAG